MILTTAAGTECKVEAIVCFKNGPSSNTVPLGEQDKDDSEEKRYGVCIGTPIEIAKEVEDWYGEELNNRAHLSGIKKGVKFLQEGLPHLVQVLSEHPDFIKALRINTGKKFSDFTLFERFINRFFSNSNFMQQSQFEIPGTKLTEPSTRSSATTAVQGAFADLVFFGKDDKDRRKGRGVALHMRMTLNQALFCQRTETLISMLGQFGWGGLFNIFRLKKNERVKAEKDRVIAETLLLQQQRERDGPQTPMDFQAAYLKAIAERDAFEKERDAFEKELLKSEEKVEELSESIDKMTILEDLYQKSNSDY